MGIEFGNDGGKVARDSADGLEKNQAKKASTEISKRLQPRLKPQLRFRHERLCIKGGCSIGDGERSFKG